MRHPWIFALALLIPAGVAFGQEKEAPSFEKVNAEFKALNEKGKALQEEYQKLFQEHQEKLTKMWPTLVQAAEAAYEAAPNKSEEVTQTLLRSIEVGLSTDDYDTVARVGKLLMEHDYQNKNLPHIAGLAAFAVNDLDSAEKYLTLAQKNNVISGLGKSWLGAIDEEKKAWKQESALRRAEAKADDLPRVLLKTSKGDIVVELFENEAPNTVANFINLVEKKFYDGLVFHRVLPGFMAQGGDPAGNGSGGPGYSIPCECEKEDHREHFRGSLAMAHAGKDSGGSQFYLTFVPTMQLNGKHTVFGRVVSGMDVLSKLQRINPEQPSGAPPDKIVSAKVLRKREHEYTVKKLADKKPPAPPKDE